MFFRLLIFWDMMLHHWAIDFQHFERPQCRHVQGSEDPRQNIRNPITRETEHLIPGEQNSQPHDCKNLKMCIECTSYILYNFQNSSVLLCSNYANEEAYKKN
jgi:hypothetical protein